MRISGSPLGGMVSESRAWPPNFREFHTSRHYVNKDKKEEKGLRLRLVLGSARARWRSSRPPVGSDGHDTVGTHHADRKQIPALSFTTFVTFGIPSQ